MVTATFVARDHATQGPSTVENRAAWNSSNATSAPTTSAVERDPRRPLHRLPRPENTRSVPSTEENAMTGFPRNNEKRCIRTTSSRR